MKKLMNLLPALALVLAVSASFAASLGTKATFMSQLKRQNAQGVWVPVTAGYHCDPDETKVCTKLFDDSGNPIAGTETYGIYRP